MALTSNQLDELEKLIDDSLDLAEATWNATMERTIIINEMKAIPSQIPGYKLVDGNDPQVDTFIAMMVDMRDSSKHLMHAISGRVTKVNQLQRVYYETSALLPAVAKTISYEQGKVTEYLGDGVLALFLVSDEQDEAMGSALRAATNCVTDARHLVNAALDHRYDLPSLDLGVGLGMSKAIVTTVGTASYLQPKVIGECVYYATKLSVGCNKIYVDATLEAAWPRSKNGKLKFRRLKTSNDVDGFEVQRAES